VKPFDDVRVRQAVCWALDRDALIKVYAGIAVPAGEFLPLGMPGAAPLGRYMPRDVERARRLLREAGYPDGIRVRLHGWTLQPGPRLLEIVQRQLADAGIEAELDLGEVVGYTSMAGDTANRVAFGLYAWNADYVDPSNFYDVLLNGRRITPVNNLNLGMFDDPQVNAWIAEAMATADTARRAALWQEVGDRVMDLAPGAMMIHQFESRLWSPRGGGWYRHITRILKLESLFVKTPSAAAPVAGAR
jgi:peptide/nickel transport system substrate-binding protein